MRSRFRARCPVTIWQDTPIRAGTRNKMRSDGQTMWGRFLGQLVGSFARRCPEVQGPFGQRHGQQYHRMPLTIAAGSGGKTQYYTGDLYGFAWCVVAIKRVPAANFKPKIAPVIPFPESLSRS